MTPSRSSPGCHRKVAAGRITMGCDRVLVWGQVSDLPDSCDFWPQIWTKMGPRYPASGRDASENTLQNHRIHIPCTPCFLFICPTANPTYLGTGVFAEVARVQMGHAARRFWRTCPLPRCECRPQTARPRCAASDLLRRFHHRPMEAG